MNDSELRIDGGTGWNDGASLSLSGKNSANAYGNILLHTTDGTNTSELLLAPDGSLTWNGVAISLSNHTHTKSQITDFPTIPSNTSQLTNDSGYITSSGSCNYANSAGNSDTLDGYHEYSFLRNRGATSTSGEGTLWAQIGIKEYYNALPDGLSDVYGYGETVSLAGTSCRFDIYCSHNSSNGNGLYYRSGWNDDKKAWRCFIDSANIGSQSVNYANSAGSVLCDVPAESFWAPLSGVMAANDNYRIRAGGTNNGGELWIETADDGNEPIGFAQYTGTFASVTRSGYLLNSSGNTEFPGTLFTYNGAVIRRNGIPTPGWGMDANTQSVLQIRTEDNTEPSICLHRSGYSHIVLAEQGGQFGVHAQGGSFDRCNTESNTVLNGYRIYVG